MSNLNLHLLMMAVPVVALLWIMLDRKISALAALVLGGSIALCSVVAINALSANTRLDLIQLMVRSEMYSAALGERRIRILDREYRLERIPRSQDDLDNDDEDDSNPEIPV